MSTWLCLGCSPGAPEGLARAQVDFQIDATITVNAGIELLPQPDYIFSFDTIAAAKYREPWNRARELGTRLVTIDDHEQMMLSMGVSGFDVKIRRSDQDVIAFGAKQFATKGHSGMYATHFAAMQATRVILVGQDGYAPGRPDHWYHPQAPHWNDQKREQNLRQIVQPFFRRLATVLPEVEFVQYGKPNFQVGNSNWRVVEVEYGSGRSPDGAGRLEGAAG